MVAIAGLLLSDYSSHLLSRTSTSTVSKCVDHVENVLQQCDLLKFDSKKHHNVAAVCRAVTNAVHTKLNAERPVHCGMA